jgi:hypothetical protein
MPAPMAQELANLRNELASIDKSLEVAIATLIEHCEELALATQQRDDKQEQTVHALIAADLIVIRTYLAEMKERALGEARLPRFNRAVNACLAKAGLPKRLLLAEMKPTLHWNHIGPSAMAALFILVPMIEALEFW